MTHMLEEQIVQIISATTKRCTSDIGFDTTLKQELDVDSLQLINIILAVEEKLELNFDESDLQLEHFLTPRTIADLVRSTRETSRSPSHAVCAQIAR